MIIQLTTIDGRKLLRNFPADIETQQEFKKWISRHINGTEFTHNTKSIIHKKIEENIIIRANGHSINDNVIKQWRESQKNTNTKTNIMSPMENLVNVEWQFRGRGGFIMEVIEAVIAIFRLMLFIPKFLIWVGELIIWSIKFLIFLVNTVFIVLSKDGILGLIKFIVNEIVLLPFKVFGYLAKHAINTLGSQTVYGIWGADNARNSNLGRPPSDSTLQGDQDIECDGKQKCYISPDGSVPFGVVVVTVLCPPVGVFMEYGIHGWLKILVCLLLTLMLYFPGLIYALLLLYC